GNLLGAIVQIAQSMHLNVAFDQQVELAMKGRALTTELRDVSASEALEIILQTNNLMYSQAGRRTVVITMDSPQNRVRPEQLSFGLGLPTSSLSFFQDKGKAKLLAFTQVHVLDNEQHQVRIGQRVPVKTGSSAVLSLASTSTATTTATGAAPTPNSSGLGTVDNIQYENVGLNIDIQPQVFDNEIQVKMKIESSSVDRSTGDLTPSF